MIEKLGDMLIFLAFLPLGACIGSFLNVVIYRLPYRKSLVSPPSTCPHCNTLIPFWYNIPVLGWLIIRGRSKCCGQKVSIRYPLVELFCALLWGFIALQLKQMHFAAAYKAGLITFFLLYFSTLLAITFIDFDHQIIPDELDIGGLVVSLVASAALPQMHPDFVQHFAGVHPSLASLMGSLVGAVVGGGVLLVITLIGTVAYHKKIKEMQQEDPEIDTAIGLGDVKLLAFIGAATGWKYALCSLFIACFSGGLVGIIQKVRTGENAEKDGAGMLDNLLNRWRTGESLMPFGPYICLGSLVMFFAGPYIIAWLGRYFAPLANLL